MSFFHFHFFKKNSLKAALGCLLSLLTANVSSSSSASSSVVLWATDNDALAQELVALALKGGDASD